MNRKQMKKLISSIFAVNIISLTAMASGNKTESIINRISTVSAESVSQEYFDPDSYVGAAEVTAKGKMGENVSYILYSDGKLEISGSGDMSDGCSISEYTKKVTSIVFNSSDVTSIGQNAFKNCVNLTSVSVPGTIKSIGESAFEGCSNLKTAVIGKETEEIGANVFRGCYALEELTIPSASRVKSNTEGNGTYMYGGQVSDIIEYNYYSGCAITDDYSIRKITVLDGASVPDHAFYEMSMLQEVVLPSTVKYIGNSAFCNCSGLVSFTMPSSVKNTGERIFENCSSLKKVRLSSKLENIGPYAFKDCINMQLASNVLPASVKEIGNSAFENCRKFKNIVISEGTETIGSDVFCGCFALEELTIPSASRIRSKTEGKGEYMYGGQVSDIICYNYYSGCAVTDDYAIHKITILGGDCIPDQAFYGMSMLDEIVIPDSVTYLGKQAFYGCKNLVSVIMSDNITEMGSAVFEECTGLTTVKLSSSLISVSERAFFDCEKLVLSSPEIPASVRSIGNNAFEGCSSFKNIIIGENTEEIGTDVFYRCFALEEITIPTAGRMKINAEGKGTYHYGGQVSDIFSYNYYASCVMSDEYALHKVTVLGGECVPDDAFFGMSMLDEIILPDTVKYLGNHAFEGCSGLSEFVMPSSVTETGDCVFQYCSGLKTVKLSARLKNISRYAFAHCTGLTSFTVPSSVTEVGDYAFYYCSGLKKAVINKNTQRIGTDVFYMCYALEELTVPFAGRNAEHISDTEKYYYGEQVSDIFSFNYYAGCVMSDEYALHKVTVLGGECVPDDAFYEMTSLEEVVIPASVKYIASESFGRCSSLKKISFKGTMKQWKEVVIDDSFINSYELAVHCSDGIYHPSVFKITKNPSDVVAGVDQKVTFKAAAEGPEVTYAWYYKSVGTDTFRKSAATGKTYTTESLASRNGFEVYCVATDKYGRTKTTRTAVLTVKMPPEITKQPKNVSIREGKTAKFTAAAEGEGLTYNWYYKSVGSDTFKKSSSVTDTYTITATEARNGFEVYCEISDAYGNTVKTKTAALKVLPFLITEQPESLELASGRTAEFTVAADTSDVTYTWYYKSAGTTAFRKSSATGNKYSIKASMSRNGFEVYCVITDSKGRSMTSKKAVLSVYPAITITEQPASVQLKSGSKAEFTVKATGEDLKYTWYYKSVGANEFKKSATESDTYSIAAKASRNGFEVYCVVSDAAGNTVTTDKAILTVK